MIIFKCQKIGIRSC